MSRGNAESRLSALSEPNSPIVPAASTAAVETLRPAGRKGFVFLAALMLGLTVLATVLTIVARNGASFAWAPIVLWIATLAGLYFIIAGFRSFTELRPDGLRTRGFGRLHECPWTEVTSITDMWRDNGRGLRYVVVATSSGKQFRLGAPLGGPDYHEQLGRIEARSKGRDRLRLAHAARHAQRLKGIARNPSIQICF